MNIYTAVLKNVAQQYEKQDNVDTLIVLTKNEGNTGGHCTERNFKANTLYKIILPVALPSPENFVLVASSYESGSFHGLCMKEKSVLLTEYEETTTSFYLKFKKDVSRFQFFTNIL